MKNSNYQSTIKAQQYSTRKKTVAGNNHQEYKDTLSEVVAIRIAQHLLSQTQETTLTHSNSQGWHVLSLFHFHSSTSEK